MADTKKIIIEITGSADSSGDGDGENGSSKGSKSPKSTMNKLFHPIKTGLSEGKKGAKSLYKGGHEFAGTALLIGVQATESILNMTGSTVDMALSRYCSLSEDYLSQQFISNTKTTINSTKSFINSLTNGAVAGYMTGGMAGVGVGIAFSGVNWLANQYVEYQTRMSGYYQTLNASNMQREYSASRLGLTDNSRGTEN